MRSPGPIRNAKSFGGNPDALYLISRSSGSHLASCVLITEWEKQGLPRNILKGAVMGSGMYDLAPVRLSKRSSFVKFTDAMVQDLSAMRHIDKIHTPVVIGVGALETPEFQRQAREFAAALKAAGKPARADRRARLQSLRDRRDDRAAVCGARPRRDRHDGAQQG